MNIFVWGVVKESVYPRNPQSIDELKDYIYEEFTDLDSNREFCRRVCNSGPERL